MTAYATADDYDAYADTAWAGDEDALEKLLERATREIDTLMGVWPIRTTGNFAGFKFDPGELADWEAAALARATSAQAEYLDALEQARQADAAAAGANDGKGAVTREKGPDFEIAYAGASSAVAAATSSGSGRIGPRVRGELAAIPHLRRLSGRARP